MKIECDCRKPKPGMLLRAAEDYNIDLSKSFMIGDSEADAEAGLKAGCVSYQISQNDGASLIKAIDTIIGKDGL